jgi:hypothetical protein
MAETTLPNLRRTLFFQGIRILSSPADGPSEEVASISVSVAAVGVFVVSLCSDKVVEDVAAPPFP